MAVEVSERPPLLAKAKLAIAAGVLLALCLAILASVALRLRAIEKNRKRLTVEALYKLRAELPGWDDHGLKINDATPKAHGDESDPTGQRALNDWFLTKVLHRFYRPPGLPSESIVVDGWGHPILYRCPGPVHGHGWDLYSVGANGIDERGGGDDILIGEDVSDVESAR